MVVGIVSVVERIEVFWVVVAGVTVSGVRMSVVINNWVVGIVLELEFLIVVAITIGDLVGVTLNIVEDVHMLLVDGILLELCERVFTWDGSKMLGEQVLDIVVLEMRTIEHVVVENLIAIECVIGIVRNVRVSTVRVSVEVDYVVSGIMLLLELLVVVAVAVRDLVRIFSEVSDVAIIDLGLGLEHSNLSTGISTATESPVFDDTVFRISSIEDLLVVSGVTIAEILTWLVITLQLQFVAGIKHGIQLCIGHHIDLRLALSETSITTDGVPSRAGEPSILNDIISLIGLLLKLLVLSRVTITNLIARLILRLLLLSICLLSKASITTDSMSP